MGFFCLRLFRVMVSVLVGGVIFRWPWVLCPQEFLLNGKPGGTFIHRRGMRQGDLLALMLFILALEPLQCILTKATGHGLLSPVMQWAEKMRTSSLCGWHRSLLELCQGGAFCGLGPLHFFGNVSGLQVNLNKCVAYPIHCDHLGLQDLLSAFGGLLGGLAMQLFRASSQHQDP